LGFPVVVSLSVRYEYQVGYSTTTEFGGSFWRETRRLGEGLVLVGYQ
jgi:hypothetical protein